MVMRIAARVDLYTKTLAQIRDCAQSESLDSEGFQILKKHKASILVVTQHSGVKEISLTHFLAKHLLKSETGRLGKEEGRADLLRLLSTNPCS